MISLLVILIISMSLIIYHSFNNIEGKINIGKTIKKTTSNATNKIESSTVKATDKVAPVTINVAKQVAKVTTNVEKQVAKVTTEVAKGKTELDNGVKNIVNKARQIGENFVKLLNLALTKNAHNMFDDFIK